MALIPWNPFREMDHMNEDLNRLFNIPGRFFEAAATPRVDVYQTENDVIVKAEIPGVSKEDLNLYVDENRVRLSGQIRRENEFKEENAYRSERVCGSFSRTIPMPVEVKSDETKAEYKDGILTVRIPKAEPSKPKGKRIDIQ